MRRNVIILVIGLVAILALSTTGCREDDVFYHHENYNYCSDEMRDREGISGDPDEINRYDSDNYHSRTYWYYCDGFSETFTWGENVKGCEIHTNTYEPICN